MQSLDNDIKSGSFKRVYLIYGEESFLVKEYENKLKESIIPAGAETMNLSVFDGKGFSGKEISEAIDTMPFFSEYRLVIVRDSGFFTIGRKDDTDLLAEYVKSIPDTSVLIFCNEKVDKRNALYKAVKKNGYVCEINMLKEKDLTNWVIKLSGNKISSSDSEYFIKNIGVSMVALKEEMTKLLNYTGDKKITREDIDIACTKSVESNIFDMVGAIGSKNTELALDIYGNLLNMKESPLGILKMIARQFKMILECKYLLRKRYTKQQIANELGLREFIVAGCINQSRNFTLGNLMKAVEDCAKCDIDIKRGLIQDKLGVEIIILKYAK